MHTNLEWKRDETATFSPITKGLYGHWLRVMLLHYACTYAALVRAWTMAWFSLPCAVSHGLGWVLGLERCAPLSHLPPKKFHVSVIVGFLLACPDGSLWSAVVCLLWVGNLDRPCGGLFFRLYCTSWIWGLIWLVLRLTRMCPCLLLGVGIPMGRWRWGSRSW